MAQTHAKATPARAAVSESDKAEKLVAAAKYAEALDLYRRMNATALSPRDAVGFATALSATGDGAGAEATIVAALERFPESPALNDAMGALLAQTGRMEEAIARFEQAVAADPSFMRAQYHLGAALLGADRTSEALPPLKLAAAALPDNFDVQLQLGRALSLAHEDQAALGPLRRAVLLQHSAATEALYELALALQASGDPAAALPLFAKVTANASAGQGARYTNYALAKVQTGDAPGALVLYAHALELGPDTATLREDYGAARLQQARLDDALTQFRAGLALEPDNAHLHYDVGLAFKLKDDLASAVPEFERAAVLDPALPDPAYTLGVIFMQQGRSAEAIVQLQKATSLQPLNGDAWALLGNVLKDAGDPGARDALRHAVQLEPEQPSLHVQLAALDAQAGDAAGAAAERKIAADLSRAAVGKQRASFALKSGQALLAQGKLPEAEAQLQVAIQADPAAAEPHHLLALLYDRQGKMTQAASERNKAQTLEQPTAAK